MKHPHAEPLTKAIDLLKQTNDAVKEILSHKDLMSIRAFIESHQLKSLNYLNALLGHAPELADVHQANTYGPVTHFFGKPVDRTPALTKKDLTPQKQEQLRFFAERDNLYDQFPVLTDDQLLDKANTPGGENIIRAVAKKIGLADYKTRQIDTIFFDEIRGWIIAEKEEETALRTAEGALGKTDFEPNEEFNDRNFQ